MSVLCASDYKRLYVDTDGYNFTRTIKVLKSIRFYGQQFGSMHAPQTRNSSFLMALYIKTHLD